MEISLSKDTVIDMISDTDDVIKIGSNKLHNLSDAEMKSVLDNHTDIIPWQFGTISKPDEAKEIFSMLDL